VPTGNAGHAQKWRTVIGAEGGGHPKVVPITAFSETDLLPGFAAV
jgi:hypothetical protein